MRNKARKTKKYKIKKYKNYVPPSNYPEAHSSEQASTNPTPKPKPETQSQPQQALSSEEEPQSIAEMKVGDYAPPEKKIVEFKGKEIDLSEGEEFTFEEQIVFINSTNLFYNRDEALQQIKELSKLLKKDKSIHVTIIGNTATNMPNGDVIYGGEPIVLLQRATYNGIDNKTIRDVMIGRAKRVYDLLKELGVSPNQMDYKTGTYRMWARERVVSFVLKKE